MAGWGGGRTGEGGDLRSSCGMLILCGEKRKEDEEEPKCPIITDNTEGTLK